MHLLPAPRSAKFEAQSALASLSTRPRAFNDYSAFLRALLPRSSSAAQFLSARAHGRTAAAPARGHDLVLLPTVRHGVRARAGLRDEEKGTGAGAKSGITASSRVVRCPLDCRHQPRPRDSRALRRRNPRPGLPADRGAVASAWPSVRRGRAAPHGLVARGRGGLAAPLATRGAYGVGPRRARPSGPASVEYNFFICIL